MQRTEQDLQEDYINFLASMAEVDIQTARRILQKQNGDVTKAVDSLLAGNRAASVVDSTANTDDDEMTRAIRLSIEELASQSSSLYQKCLLLRDKLLRIRGFREHFPELTSSSDSTDPVAQLWDLFSMGTPLCYIFDQLPPEDGFKKFENYSLTKRDHEPNLDRAKKHAVALFAIEVRNLLRKLPQCEIFTVTDLWNRDSTGGLVKVVNTVTAIVNYLPKDVFDDAQLSTTPVTDRDTNAPQDSIIREMLETEHKYVQDFETIQFPAKALSNQGYYHQPEVIHGSNATNSNEAQRRKENAEILTNLKNRVQNWKGHRIENFGDLLHDVFVIEKSDVNGVYAAFLFSKILILCKADHNHQNRSKDRDTEDWAVVSSVPGFAPLLLKGRVYMCDIVSATYIPTHANGKSDHYPLVITWKEGDRTKSITITITIKCVRQEQLEQWQESINRNIQDYTIRRLLYKPQDTPVSKPQSRDLGSPLDSRYSTIPNLTFPLSSPRKEDYHGDYEGGLQREKQPDGQELLSDSDNDLEEYPPPSYPPSGRDTPLENRLLTRSRSLPSRSHFGLSKLSTSKEGQTHLRARSNSLPADMLIFSDTTSKPSNNARTPPKTPQASNMPLPPIPEDLFQSPPRFRTSKSANVKVKVHFKDDIFVILVLRKITHNELIERIKDKCRSCGPLPIGPLKVKYSDEDGDLISLTSTEDLQLAFEQLEPGKYVSFYVS